MQINIRVSGIKILHMHIKELSIINKISDGIQYFSDSPKNASHSNVDGLIVNNINVILPSANKKFNCQSCKNQDNWSTTPADKKYPLYKLLRKSSAGRG